MKYKISDLGITITGTTPSTKNKDYYSNDYLFVGPSDLNSQRYILKTEKHISQIAFNDYKSRFLNKNDIAVSCIGSLGYIAIANQPCLTNQQINSITRINTSIVNPLYLYYKLCTMNKYFNTIGGNGTTLPIINKTLFKSIEIDIHDLKEQQHIVNTSPSCKSVLQFLISFFIFAINIIPNL